MLMPRNVLFVVAQLAKQRLESSRLAFQPSKAPVCMFLQPRPSCGRLLRTDHKQILWQASRRSVANQAPAGIPCYINDYSNRPSASGANDDMAALQLCRFSACEIVSFRDRYAIRPFTMYPQTLTFLRQRRSSLTKEGWGLRVNH